MKRLISVSVPSVQFNIQSGKSSLLVCACVVLAAARRPRFACYCFAAHPQYRTLSVAFLMQQTILGEMPMKQDGQAETRILTRSVGYVSQRPFIMSGTVADNICFGAEFSQDRMRDACELAAFSADLLQLRDGIETLVGERGVFSVLQNLL